MSYGEFERAAALIEKLSDERTRANARYTLFQSTDQKRIDDGLDALKNGDFDRAEVLARQVSRLALEWHVGAHACWPVVPQRQNRCYSNPQRILSASDGHQRGARAGAEIDAPCGTAAVSIDSNRAFDEMNRAITEFNQAGFMPELERYIDLDTFDGSGKPRAINIGLGALLGNWDLYWLGSSGHGPCNDTDSPISDERSGCAHAAKCVPWRAAKIAGDRPVVFTVP